MTRDKIQENTIKRIKLLTEWDSERKFTSFELKSASGYTGNTLRALVRKGIIERVKDAPVDEPEYYVWTGKELD